MGDPGLGAKTGTRKCTYGNFDGAMLSLPPDRVRIIAGWLDSGVCLQEETCDIVATSYKNYIGDALSIAYWKDSDFDRNGRAFHYVRVLDFPTDYWTTFDATRKE